MEDDMVEAPESPTDPDSVVSTSDAVVSDDAVSRATLFPGDDWIARLSMTGPIREEAIGQLHALMIRAARHQVSRMPDSAALGAAVREDIVNSAADDATIAVLGRLDSFEGRSRFTTWAYKFGILQAGVHVRRARWKGREIQLREIAEPAASHAASPEAHSEGRDLAQAVNDAIASSLTAHQQRVAVALLIDEVPIDVLAERLGTTRNALYKTLHDVRKRLRTELESRGFEAPGRTRRTTEDNDSTSRPEEVNR